MNTVANDINGPAGRLLMLDEVQWENGWPYVEGNTASFSWNKPLF